MAGSSATMDPAGELPLGMWFYSFMFDDKHLLPGRVASGTLPAPTSLLLGLVVGTALTAVRFTLDAVVFKPVARRVLGFPRRRILDTGAPALNSLCAKSKILSPEEVAEASASTGLPPEEVKGYAKAHRLASAENKKINKFKEAAWRLVVYLALVIYGLQVSFRKDWFKDPELVWEDWPLGIKADGLEAYYHVAMGVYWHLIIFQFWDTRRSDFWQMLIHHLATLFLLTYSWLMSLVRIGTLIMVCHDISDIFLETAKLFNYAQKRSHWCHIAADGFFVVFAAVFGVSRLYLFPKYMVLSVWRTTALSEVSRLFFCGLLSTLLVLHVFWFHLIMRMVYMFVFHGVEEDIRSDNEEDAGAAAAAPTNGHGGHKSGADAAGNGVPRSNGKKRKTT